MMKYERFTWKTEKLQHSDDEVIMVVDNANEDWKGHILNVVDMLNELNDERMMYKTTIDKKIVELEEENEQLRNELTFLNKVISFFADNPMTKYSSKSELLEEMKLLEEIGLI